MRIYRKIKVHWLVVYTFYYWSYIYKSFS